MHSNPWSWKLPVKYSIRGGIYKEQEKISCGHLQNNEKPQTFLQDVRTDRFGEGYNTDDS